MPLGLVNVALREANHMHAASDAMWKAEIEARGAKATTSERAKQKFVKINMRPPSKRAKNQMVDFAAAILNKLLNDKTFDEVRFATRALFYASVSSSWGIFESVARDSWIAAVNSRPTLLAQEALAKNTRAGIDDPLRNKQVSVSILARYGYDLLRKMGVLLAPKFDFTSISGIREAFAATSQKVPRIDKALANPKLGQLEVTRHLIVHRAGWIDEEYQRRTGVQGFLGKRLSLDGAKASELSNAAIEAGNALLMALDRWMSENHGEKTIGRRRAATI
jgi:hypothetical protein